jgi:hypothetical protein
VSPTRECSRLLTRERYLQPSGAEGLLSRRCASSDVNIVLIAAQIRLADASLIVTVDPSFGGHVSSLALKGTELLARGERARSQDARSRDFAQAGLGGLDDCVPAIAAGRHPTGRHIPDHGELWYRPAEVIARTRSSLTIAMRGEQLPFHLVRRLTVNASQFAVDYELTNAGATPLPLLWAAHPLFACSDEMRLALPAGPWTPVFSSAPASVREFEVRVGDATFDLGAWDTVPEGCYVKVFAAWDGATAGLDHPTLGCRVRIRLDARRPAHLGLWINRRGFPPNAPVTHVALEPTFGSSDDLETSLAAGSCLIVAPHAREEWRVMYAIEETR